MWLHRWRTRRRDRGALGALVAIMAPAVIGLMGLVFDGGLALEARQRGLDTAEQAARAAANQCDLAVLRAEADCRITPAVQGQARAAAEALMGDGVSMTGFAVTDGDHTVTVTVTVTSETTFLKIFGIGDFTIQLAPRSATAVTDLA